MKTKLISLLALLGLTLNFAAQAEVKTGIVGSDEIDVGTTSIPINGIPVPSLAGLPGIGYLGLAEGKLVSFEALQSVAPDITTGDGTPGNWKETHITPEHTNEPHGDLGYFDFVQVANETVYFGEWSKTGVNTDDTHTVYYAGEAGNVIGNLPTQTATYTVVGINNGALLSGSLTANFGGDNQLTGEFSNDALTIGITATIYAKDARFSGTATANEDGDYGFTEGHFFGNGATALAGIANFGAADPRNTAFGGAKD